MSDEPDLEQLRADIDSLEQKLAMLAEHQQEILGLIDKLADDNRATEVAEEAVKVAMGLDEDEDLDKQPPDRMFN